LKAIAKAHVIAPTEGRFLNNTKHYVLSDPKEKRARVDVCIEAVRVGNFIHSNIEERLLLSVTRHPILTPLARMLQLEVLLKGICSLRFRKGLHGLQKFPLTRCSKSWLRFAAEAKQKRQLTD
jgi:hypothetical protein